MLKWSWAGLTQEVRIRDIYVTYMLYICHMYVIFMSYIYVIYNIYDINICHKLFRRGRRPVETELLWPRNGCRKVFFLCGRLLITSQQEGGCWMDPKLAPSPFQQGHHSLRTRNGQHVAKTRNTLIGRQIGVRPRPSNWDTTVIDDMDVCPPFDVTTDQSMPL